MQNQAAWGMATTAALTFWFGFPELFCEQTARGLHTILVSDRQWRTRSWKLQQSVQGLLSKKRYRQWKEGQCAARVCGRGRGQGERQESMLGRSGGGVREVLGEFLHNYNSE